MGYEKMKGWAFERTWARVARLGRAWTTDDEKLSNAAYTVMSGPSQLGTSCTTYLYQVIRSRIHPTRRWCARIIVQLRRPSRIRSTHDGFSIPSFSAEASSHIFINLLASYPAHRSRIRFRCRDCRSYQSDMVSQCPDVHRASQLSRSSSWNLELAGSTGTSLVIFGVRSGRQPLQSLGRDDGPCYAVMSSSPTHLMGSYMQY
ncbi:hypothetical protein V8E53_007969 [Lactarius tabidus]